MAEPNKLDEPLTEAEYDTLEAFFGSNAVPQDCMDLEMLDGFLTAIVSGPELIQPSEWLPVVWSDSQRSVSPVFADNEQAERILSLHPAPAEQHRAHAHGFADALQAACSIVPRKGESGSADRRRAKDEAAPPEASAWCEGYMTGVLLREESWEPIYASETTRDWMLPIEALAYGDHDPEYLDWVDTRREASRHDRRAADRRGAHPPLLAGAAQRRGVNRAERRAQRREARAQGAAATALS